ncbi:GRP family sugar transporter [Holzapfeliella sp. He02]|uniref:GRP family sugar transporter n=1 Tax=Holzapfeliella saturejae TaxID=3082953 RepID=A0ABU8SJV4_9LACO
MAILIGFLPAIFWGMGPVISRIFGGKPIQQLFGMTVGQVVIGLGVYLIYRPEIQMIDFLWCFIAGAAWSLAQLAQLTSFTKINVSSAMPISTGFQLIEIPLVGVIVWNEWSGSGSKLIGFASIAVLIIGIVLSSFNEDKESQNSKNMISGIIILFFSSLGYTATATLPKIGNAGGVASVLPQTLGSVVMAAVIILFLPKKQEESYVFAKPTYKSIITGLFGGLGTLAYLTSMSMNGVATAFPMTQLNVVVATLGGVILLKERKTKKESLFTIIGLILIIGSAVMISRLS